MTCRKAQLCGSIALGLYAAAMTIAGNAALAQDVPTATIYSSTKIGNTLSLPTDVGVGENGHIYVVDGGNHQVAVFDKTGRRVNTLGRRRAMCMYVWRSGGPFLVTCKRHSPLYE